MAAMKKVVAVIRPFRLDEVKDRLWEAGVRGVTVTEVKVEGDRDPLEELGISEGFVPRLKVEVVVADGMAEEVEETLAEVLAGGDALVYTIDVEDAVRVRTGERGEDVL